jgi:hypothetical protein
MKLLFCLLGIITLMGTGCLVHDRGYRGGAYGTPEYQRGAYRGYPERQDYWDGRDMRTYDRPDYRWDSR